MARPKLWKLNPMDFTKMTPKRNEVIESAEAKPLPPTDSYKPNEIAKALHPGVQYLKVSKIVENENLAFYRIAFYLDRCYNTIMILCKGVFDYAGKNFTVWRG